MSEVYPQPIPEVLWYDWAVIYAGLGIGVSVIFELIDRSVSKENKHRVYTLSNFWLILSGVIHVSAAAFALITCFLCDYGMINV